MSAVFIPYREVFMNYAGIKEYDIANGPGIRFSLFVSGCTHHCKGCFNPDTWSFHYGKPFTKETEDYIIRQLGQDCYQGMTLLGCEPMELLKYIDILVDGEFVLAKKDITLLFKGSSNQRTIDVQKSLHAGELCFWNPGDTSMSKMTKI